LAKIEKEKNSAKKENGKSTNKTTDTIESANSIAAKRGGYKLTIAETDIVIALNGEKIKDLSEKDSACSWMD